MARALRHTFRCLIPGAHRPGERLALDAADAHHLIRVVRRRVGEGLEVSDGAGGLWAATLVAQDPALVEIGEPLAVSPPAPVRLVIGLLDSQRLDMVVEKATELGVGECVIALTERVHRRPAADAWTRRLARLERVATAAAGQTGAARIMPVRGLVPFERIVTDTITPTGVLIDPRGTDSVRPALRAAAAGSGTVGSLTVAVGPEAGFSPDEVTAARNAGWPICPLGPQILRAETAALSTLTLALAALGRFGEDA
ncbi:MAG TPA: RsmE family RNA methyltransferase [Miltoncostaeaceae bacterium]|nr:RsmE family RNA methyltransferase [Miltoncostaeaceae bacterium]